MFVMSGDRQFYLGGKALITDSKDRILILRKVPRKASQKWKPYWDLPGGKMQNLNIKNTLLREVYEEIGVRKIGVGELLDAAVANFKTNGGGNLMLLIYRCSILDGSKLELSTEHSEFRWVSKREAATRLAHMLPKDSLKRIFDT